MFCLPIKTHLFAICIVASLCSALHPPITAAPNLHRRQEPGQDSPSCSGFYSLESSCSALIPNFNQQPLQSQLDCVCYISSTWAGSIFDGYFDTCLAYLSTASPSVYASLGISTGWVTTPCEQFSPVATSAEAACFQFSSIEVSCSLETSNFESLPLSSQASCLCYSSSTYDPGRFDSAWDGCLLLYSSSNSSYYASITGDKIERTPCAKEGNVRSGPTAVTSTTGTLSPGPSVVQPLTTTEPQPTGQSGSAASVWTQKILAKAVFVALSISTFIYNG